MSGDKNSGDLGSSMLVIIWPFTLLAIITVTLKLVSRAHLFRALGWDDFFIFLSLLLSVICSVIFTYDVYLGMGQQASILAKSGKLTEAIRWNYIGNPFCIMAYSFPNISVAILLERLLAPNKMRSSALHGLAGSQVLAAALSAALLFVQCSPIELNWNLHAGGTCMDADSVVGFFYFVGGK